MITGSLLNMSLMAFLRWAKAAELARELSRALSE
jgi:hypothetical protein